MAAKEVVMSREGLDKLKAELSDTMAMCGAHSLADIDRSMIFGY